MPYRNDLVSAHYDYPPSRFIKQFGPIDEDSHFFAKGEVEYDGNKISCEFEVVYTQDSKIVVIIYGQSLARLKQNTPSTLTGEGLRRFEHRDIEEQVIVLDVHLNSVLAGSLGGDDYSETVFSCFASQVIVNSGEAEAFKYFSSPESIQYFLTGLPVIQQSKYDSKRIASLKLEFEEIEFEIQLPEHFAAYSSQANAILEFTPTHTPRLPLGWDLDDFVETCCALLSLAIGRDVQWTEKRQWVMAPDWKYDSYYPSQYVYSAEQHSWIRRRKIYGQQTIHPFIVSVDYSQTEDTLQDLSKFLERIMQSALQLDVAAIRDYSAAIRHFVEYLFLTERREDQARLVTTSIEELLSRWHRHTGTKPDDYFNDRLKTLFANYSVNVGGLGAKQIQDIMTTFVKTRNNIVHQGEFVETTPQKQILEYQNMLLVLPLIVFRIFNYSGSFNLNFSA